MGKAVIEAATPGAIGARIVEARGTRTQKEYAALLRVDVGTLGRYERGERSPDVDFIAAISAKGDVNPNWLLYGLGARSFMEAGGGDRDAVWERSAAGAPRVVADPQPTAGTSAGYGYAQIPLLNVRARGGGNGTLNEGERAVDSLAFKEDWIRRELRVLPSDLRLIYVEGDSMEPDLRSGDIILIDHTDTTARREGIYVLRMDGALLVKTLQRLPGGVLRVLSKNELYEPFSVTAADVERGGDFAVIGRVVWACRRY